MSKYSFKISELDSLVAGWRKGRGNHSFSNPKKGLLLHLIGEYGKTTNTYSFGSAREKARRWMSNSPLGQCPWKNSKLTKKWEPLTRAIIRAYLFACPTTTMLKALNKFCDSEGFQAFRGTFEFAEISLQEGMITKRYLLNDFEVLLFCRDPNIFLTYAIFGCFLPHHLKIVGNEINNFFRLLSASERKKIGIAPTSDFLIPIDYTSKQVFESFKPNETIRALQPSTNKDLAKENRGNANLCNLFQLEGEFLIQLDKELANSFISQIESFVSPLIDAQKLSKSLFMNSLKILSHRYDGNLNFVEKGDSNSLASAIGTARLGPDYDNVSFDPTDKLYNYFVKTSAAMAHRTAQDIKSFDNYNKIEFDIDELSQKLWS